LQYCAGSLRGDREICEAATSQNGEALQYCAVALRGDRELCRVAATQDGRALQYCAGDLRGDREICKAAASQNGRALQYCAGDLRVEQILCRKSVDDTSKAQSDCWWQIEEVMNFSFQVVQPGSLVQAMTSIEVWWDTACRCLPLPAIANIIAPLSRSSKYSYLHLKNLAQSLDGYLTLTHGPPEVDLKDTAAIFRRFAMHHGRWFSPVVHMSDAQEIELKASVVSVMGLCGDELLAIGMIILADRQVPPRVWDATARAVASRLEDSAEKAWEALDGLAAFNYIPRLVELMLGDRRSEAAAMLLEGFGRVGDTFAPHLETLLTRGSNVTDADWNAYSKWLNPGSWKARKETFLISGAHVALKSQNAVHTLPGYTTLHAWAHRIADHLHEASPGEAVGWVFENFQSVASPEFSEFRSVALRTLPERCCHDRSCTQALARHIQTPSQLSAAMVGVFSVLFEEPEFVADLVESGFAAQRASFASIHSQCRQGRADLCEPVFDVMYRRNVKVHEKIAVEEDNPMVESGLSMYQTYALMRKTHELRVKGYLMTGLFSVAVIAVFYFLLYSLQKFESGILDHVQSATEFRNNNDFVNAKAEIDGAIDEIDRSSRLLVAMVMLVKLFGKDYFHKQELFAFLEEVDPEEFIEGLSDNPQSPGYGRHVPLASIQSSQKPGDSGVEMKPLGNRSNLEKRTSKFVFNRFISADPRRAAEGLKRFLAVSNHILAKLVHDPVGAIREEWESLHDPDVDKWINYIIDEPAKEVDDPSNDGKSIQQRDRGNAGLYAKDFLEREPAKQAGLSLAHVIALRIYTSCLFSLINKPLRENKDGFKRGSPHRCAATVLMIHEALCLLRVNIEDTDEGEPHRFWRGMRDLMPDPAFLKSGGTETACMSTTTSKQIMAEYAGSDHPILICVEVDNVMSAGSDIAWLSLYPSEAEVLFPPLTYLKPIRKCRIVNHAGVVVVVRPIIS
jgi:hypothetical protein